MPPAKPDHWRYEIDPAFDPEGEVPPFGVLGAWPMNRNDEIVGDYRPNPNYEPSPVARMLDVDADDFTGAWAANARDSIPDHEFGRVLAKLEYFGVSSGDGGVVVFDIGEGPQVRAFSSERHLRAAEGAPTTLPLAGRALFEFASDGISVEINPTATGGAFFSADFLMRIAPR